MKTDSKLRADVEAELAWDARIDNREILVAVKDGVVTLGGHAPTYVDKWGAERAAKNVVGVRAVANEIDVKPPLVRSDQEIAAATLNTLKANVSVPASDIKVLVADGWVTLDGKVAHWHQRKAAEDAVQSLWGVKGINNAIEIQPPVDASDIWNKVHAAFVRHADVDADKVTVIVKDDTVTLTGEVHSWHEREDAENAAWATPGVRTVKNNLSLSV